MDSVIIETIDSELYRVKEEPLNRAIEGTVLLYPLNLILAQLIAIKWSK